jgi:hypothetical protein
MLIAGLGMTVLTASTLLSRHVRQMGLVPVVDEADEPEVVTEAAPDRASEPALAS